VQPAAQTGLQQQHQRQQQSPAVWQFHAQLLRASHVGPTGLERQRGTPMYRLARAAIFDRARHRFLGNVHTVFAAASGRGAACCWTWPPNGVGRSSLYALDPAVATATTAGTGLSTPATQDAKTVMAISPPAYTPPVTPIPPGALAGSATVAAVAAAGRPSGLPCSCTAAACQPLLVDAGSTAQWGVAGAGGAHSFITRCAAAEADPVCGVRTLDPAQLSLYIELNVAYPATPDDEAAVPMLADERVCLCV
jgi:hypothetical protein